jgi:hypothetical protein
MEGGFVTEENFLRMERMSGLLVETEETGRGTLEGETDVEKRGVGKGLNDFSHLL